MIKEIKTICPKIQNHYTCEIKVYDDEEKKYYYVVARLSDLLYATFESSYVDYEKGITKVEPKMVEGKEYLWFESENTKFKAQYNKALSVVNTKETNAYLSRKYAHIKKPVGNIKYTVIHKKSNAVFACGPLGDSYEIKVHLIDEDKDLYIYSDDAFGYYEITDYEVKEGEIVDSLIESIECFDQAKDSEYYDLYLEMEMFKDNYKQL